jgi:hypothetical protein
MGRPKGSPNKPKKALEKALNARLKAIYGEDFDVVYSMACSAIDIQRIAKESGEVEDHTAAVQALDRVAKYLTPALKSIEQTGDQNLVVSIQRKRYDTPSE